MESNQMSFDDMELKSVQAQMEVIAAELDRRKKEIAYCIGRKRFGLLIDKAPSYVNEILNTNGLQKKFQPEMEPALILENPDKFKEIIIDYLCDLCGYQHPEKKAKLPPEQELKQLKRELKARGLDKVVPEYF
jgi:hypothetical protein